MHTRREYGGRVSVARQVLVLQLALITVLIAAGVAIAVYQARGAATRQARNQVLAVAQSVAASPGVADAVGSSDPSALLQPVAERVRQRTGVDFVVVMSTTGVRYTHPNPRQIGGHFLGHLDPATRGVAFTETFTGTLGPSVRAVVPVVDGTGRVVSLVAVGITTQHVGAVLRREIPALAAIAALALALAFAGSLAVSRRLRRQTLGLGPEEITRLYQHHDAVLHAMREGLLVSDNGGTLVVANDEAMRLLQLPADAVGRPTGDVVPEGELRAALTERRVVTDEFVVAGERVLAVNQSLTERDGYPLGVVTTLRDHTDVLALAGELDTVRGFADALRASAHESANRLHTIVTLVELGRVEEAVAFGTAEITAAQALADRLLATVQEPVLAALLLGKTAQANERGVELVLGEDTRAADAGLDARDVVTVLGNLLDNAIDAAVAGAPPRRVVVTVRTDERYLFIRVGDSGPGVDPSHVEAVFTDGWTTKEQKSYGRGLGLTLVRQVVRKYGGELTVHNDGGAVFTVVLPVAQRASTP